MSGRGTTSIDRRRFLARGAAAGAAWWLGAPSRARAAERVHDLCVIGSGFAGTYLALELVERGLDVVLVEAGRTLALGENPSGDVARFPYRNVGEIDYPVDACRSISLGGTSRKWAGVSARLAPEDFEERTRFGQNVDWPIGYSDLEPHYCRAERLLEVHGDAQRSRVERSCAPPHALPAQESADGLFPGHELRFAPVPVSVRPGTTAPVRLVDVELPRLLAHPRATLRSGRAVTRLVCSPEGTVLAAETVDGDGRVERIAARRFVVAAGVVESARLLMRSAHAGAPRGLGNASGHLGAHFNAHPTLRRALGGRPEGLRMRGTQRSYTPNARFRAEGLSPVQIDLHLLASDTVLDVQPELVPADANHLRLTREVGTTAPGPVLPPIELAFGYQDRDRRSIERGLALTAELAVALGKAPDAVPDAGTVWFHPAGTCRMAARADDGVVDRDGRVFGCTNLYVSGGAVFPASGTANPTLTVVAMTLRLAEHLARLDEAQRSRG